MFATRITPGYLAAIQALMPEAKILDNPPDWTKFKRREEDDLPVNLMEIFYALDDDTVRRVFKMGSLTEGELRNIAENRVTLADTTEDSASSKSCRSREDSSSNRRECQLHSRLTTSIGL